MIRIETTYKSLLKELKKLENKQEIVEITITDPKNIIIASCNIDSSLCSILSYINDKTKLALDLSPTDLTAAKVKEQKAIFLNVSNLYKIGPLPTKIKSLVYAFSGCTKLESVDTSSFKNVKSIEGMCTLCSNLKYFNFSTLSEVENANKAFMSSGIEKADISSMKSLKFATDMFENCTALESACLPTNSCINDADCMFQFCSKLKEVNYDSLSSCTCLNHTFEETSLKTIDISVFKKAVTAKNIVDNTTKIIGQNVPKAILSDIMPLMGGLQNIELMI